MSESQITVANARRRFTRQDKSTINALDDVSFDVAAGEFLVLLGPSGCGKSTLLRTIAGLEHLDSGRIALGGTAVIDTGKRVNVPTEQRRLSMMFQSYALWPHMTVADNVAYPLRARRVSRSTIQASVQEVLASVGVGELARQYPGQISGGQAQRVALARALVAKDSIVLFDEPLSNVDAKVRERLRHEIARLHRESGFTAVYVTHDQEEALTLATRIIVMKDGRVCQSGTPQEIYDRPNSRYVARFMGSTNELLVTPTGQVVDGLAVVDSPIGPMRIDGPEPSPGPLTVFSRPEAWKINTGGVAVEEPNTWNGLIRQVVFLGSVSDITVEVNGLSVLVRSMDRRLRAGDKVRLSIDPRSLVCRPDDPAEAGSAPPRPELRVDRRVGAPR
ncbi:ABC transporter ATP-binding protein [Dactylosporangium sp. CA-152071]|uniref:ABC transporter ATP-binding protein n=1 Tax=Dactylosporangium sp. CA-152071 TaxID=3239933 RepID=UPI003D8B81D2